MNVEEKIEKFKKRYQESVGRKSECGGKKPENPIKVVNLKRKHFKKELSTDIGFGYQDLKKKPKQLITTLIGEGYDLSFTPSNIGEDDMKVCVTVNKFK